MDAAFTLDAFLNEKYGIDYAQYQRLAEAHHYEDLITVMQLLGTKEPKAKTRRDGKRKILEWLDGKNEYRTPLPFKMYAYLRPRWPVRDIEAAIAHINQMATLVRKQETSSVTHVINQGEAQQVLF